MLSGPKNTFLKKLHSFGPRYIFIQHIVMLFAWKLSYLNTVNNLNNLCVKQLL